jgi:hypothetical protein
MSTPYDSVTLALGSQLAEVLPAVACHRATRALQRLGGCSNHGDDCRRVPEMRARRRVHLSIVLARESSTIRARHDKLRIPPSRSSLGLSVITNARSTTKKPKAAGKFVWQRCLPWTMKKSRVYNDCLRMPTTPYGCRKCDATLTLLSRERSFSLDTSSATRLTRLASPARMESRVSKRTRSPER